MQAAEIMTRRVVTADPGMSVQEIAKLLVRHQISGVPIMDHHRKLVGIVSEGDLLRPDEVSRDDRAAWWLEMLAEGHSLAPSYLDHVRSGGRHARDVMTRDVVMVAPDTPLTEVAALLLKRRIKRAPVVDASGKLVGIVSRADLVRAMAHMEEKSPSTTRERA